MYENTGRVPIVARLVRPYIHAELPGWGVIAKKLNLFKPEDSIWLGVNRVITGKFHGFEVDLDLSNYFERGMYFLGRFHDKAMQEVMVGLLRHGDRFVDVGANIGEVTLNAVHLVGPEGRVDAFEPHPSRVERLRGRLQHNDLKNVVVHPVAISDSPSKAKFWVQDATTMGTLAPPPPDAPFSYSETEVSVERADEELLGSPLPVRMIKIDVDGYECQVMRGLAGIFERDAPVLVIAETIPKVLQTAESSLEEMYEIMQGYGYRAFCPELRREGLGRSLRIHQMQGVKPPSSGADLWWVLENSDAEAWVLDRRT